MEPDDIFRREVMIDREYTHRLRAVEKAILDAARTVSDLCSDSREKELSLTYLDRASKFAKLAIERGR